MSGVVCPDRRATQTTRLLADDGNTSSQVRLRLLLGVIQWREDSSTKRSLDLDSSTFAGKQLAGVNARRKRLGPLDLGKALSFHALRTGTGFTDDGA